MSRAIAWFVHNPIAANLLMAFLIVAGLVSVGRLHREEFTDISTELVSIRVDYPGGAPSEIEEGICMRIEEYLDGASDIEEMRSVALEGSCEVTLELRRGAEVPAALSEIKNRVDSIDHFPEEAEKPAVSHVVVHIPVADIAVFGNADERTLKRVGTRLRDDLLSLPGVSHAELHYVRPYEISIEISEEALRRHGLTFDEVATAVRRSSLDLPAGRLKTASGDVLLRTRGQAYVGRDFEDLIVLTHPDGTDIALGDIARVVDGFEETDLYATFDGAAAIIARVLRVGEEDALDIRQRVGAYLQDSTGWVPEGLGLVVWQDHSEEIRIRLQTLLQNAGMGLALVLLVLALFLRFRLALWVAWGIPVAFLGALTIFPWMGLSLNTLTVGAFILALGIVVDDAIVVGENIYRHLQQGGERLSAAVSGTREVHVPVVFGVLTTIAAFTPLLGIGGNIAPFFSGVGIAMMACLLASLVESQLVLPSHLSGTDFGVERAGWRGVAQRWRGFQGALGARLERFIAHGYGPFLESALAYRYVTAAGALGLLILFGALLASGRLPYEFIRPVEGDHTSAVLTYPTGTPLAVTRAGVARLQRAAEVLRAELDAELEEGEPSRVRHVVTSLGAQPFQQMMSGSFAVPSSGGGHLGEVVLALIPAAERSTGAHEIAARWRELAGPFPDAESLVFASDMFNAGNAIDVQLRGGNLDSLQGASAKLREALASYPGVIDLRDSFWASQREARLSLRPEARPLGLTLHDLARQVRQAFYGEEVQRVQRGRDEVRVMVRYPAPQRRSLGDLEELRIRAADGAEVPLATVAQVESGHGLAAIRRTDRARVVNVVADVDRSITTPGRILASLALELPEILREFPEVDFSFEGAQQEDTEASAGLVGAFALALLAIYALLAVPLHSYFQPLIIMSVIPFGAIGALVGHMILGQPLTFFSVVGVVALSGVVVNASLMLVHFINRRRAAGASLAEAARRAGEARFRPILLTSLTTFAGLLPLILEQAVPLQMFVPMAISVAFGVLLSTIVTLVLVPCEYLIIEDIAAALSRRASSRLDASEV